MTRNEISGILNERGNKCAAITKYFNNKKNRMLFFDRDKKPW
jgi:hypothetical protein